MRSEIFIASALFLLQINAARSDGFVPYKVSEYQDGLDDICAGIQIVILPHPDATLCHMFVVCMFTEPIVYECVEGYVYEPDLLSCIPGNRERCLSSAGPNWRQICANVSYAVFPDPDVCWEFVFCPHGMVNRFTCPMGEIWSQRNGACLPGSWDTCELLEIMRTCQHLPDGVLLPHPNECSRYLECSQGSTTIVHCLLECYEGEPRSTIECPGNQIFNEDIQRCVFGNPEILIITATN